jgi:hypothetical protein
MHKRVGYKGKTFTSYQSSTLCKTDAEERYNWAVGMIKRFQNGYIMQYIAAGRIFPAFWNVREKWLVGPDQKKFYIDQLIALHPRYLNISLKLKPGSPVEAWWNMDTRTRYRDGERMPMTWCIQKRKTALTSKLCCIPWSFFAGKGQIKRAAWSAV